MKEFQNYVIMAIENAPSGSLSEIIKSREKEGRKFTEEECAKAVKSILLGLRHIHSQDYVHRDLKPSNVVVDDINNLDTVKLVDFGLAIKYSHRQGIDEACGTLVYQAPEQMFGGKRYGKSVDVWAVGFIMFELITLQHPLYTKGETKQSYKEKILNYEQLNYEGKGISK